LPATSRLGVFTVGWIRWIRESINSLLPVAGVGGDVAAARLASQRGVPGPQAAASMVVDITVGAASQLIFVLIGIALLLTRSNAPDAVAVTRALLFGLALFLAAIAGFVLVQHNNMFVAFAKLAHYVTPAKWLNAFAGRASAIDDAVVAIYRQGFPVLRATPLRFAGWAAGAGEIWMAAHFLMSPLSMADAFVLESLSSAVNAAAFVVPGGLGALEGGLVLFGALFGLPADIALAISLSKRVRQLALGLPGLAVWQWIEGRRLLRSAEDKASPTPR
jgi:putative membrane protein